MFTSTTLRAARTAVFLPIAWSSAAFADDAGTSAETLESVTVTARRREESIQDVPTAVTSVSGRLIQDDELRTTKDIAREVPGATGWNAESRARPRFFIRGIGSNEATNNAVQPIGIYVDEVYLLNSLFLGGPLFDLDRVEVLRGPQGTLWGKNTTGGAYNFVSKKPDFTPNGYVRLEAGNYGQRLVEGAYGGPIEDDVLAQRVAFHYETHDGWATNRVTGKQVGDLTDLAVRYQLLARITPDLTAGLNIHVRRLDGTQTPAYPVTRPGIPTFGYTPPFVASGDRTHVDLNAGEPIANVDSSGATANIAWNVGDLTLTSITAVDAGTRENPEQDSDSTPVEVSRSYARNHARQLSQEVRLASPHGDTLSWIVGFYYFKDRNDSYSASATTLPVSTTLSGLTYTQYRQDTESKAVFGSVTWNATERLAFTGGLRFTSEEVGIDLEALGSVATINGTQPFVRSSWWNVSQAGVPLKTIATQRETNTWNNLGYDFTPQYWLAQNQLVFARVASGYRSGNYAGSSAAAPPAVVQPEKLLAFEVGYKSEWLDNRLIANANAYYYDYKDMQLTVNRVINGQFVSVLANAGRGRVKGVELEVRGRITDGITIRGNVSSLRTRFKELTTGNNVSYAGYNFARVPNLTGLVGIDYRFAFLGGGAQVGTDWSYNSKTNFNVTDNTDPYALQEGFWLGTLRASYTLPGGKTTIGAFVANVTNKTYKIQGQLYSNARYNTTLGDPRTAGMTLVTRF